MRAAVAALAVLAALIAVALVGVGDDPGPPPAARPGRAAETPGGLVELLRRGNVVVETGLPREVPTLTAMSERVMGQAFSPRLRRRGRAVEVRLSRSLRAVVAYAHGRELVVPDARDPRLERFVRYWLGRGG